MAEQLGGNRAFFGQGTCNDCGMPAVVRSLDHGICVRCHKFICNRCWPIRHQYANGQCEAMQWLKEGAMHGKL